ncbi:MAG: GNAT family protein [Acidobacteriota bacterium]|nr:GNAT family protein [Acidobacteriota bacterium]
MNQDPPSPITPNSARPTLVTQRLLLRPFQDSDALELHRLAGERAIADTTLNVPHPYPLEAAGEWIAGHEDLWRERRQMICAVTVAGEGDEDGPPGGALVGSAGLRLDLQHSRGELGYWIGVPYWRRGYATEAARAVLDFGFRGLGLHRIHAQVLGGNTASGRVLLKLGLRQEGHLREHYLKWGEPEDALVYGILRREWTSGAQAS